MSELPGDKPGMVLSVRSNTRAGNLFPLTNKYEYLLGSVVGRGGVVATQLGIIIQTTSYYINSTGSMLTADDASYVTQTGPSLFCLVSQGTRATDGDFARM